MILRIRGPELSTDPRIEFAITLDGIEYPAALQWLGRVECWMLQLYSPSGELVIKGVRLVNGSPLTYPFTDRRLPTSRHVVCHDSTNSRQDPGRNDLVDRHLFLLIDKAPNSPDYILRTNPYSPPAA